MPTDDNDRPDVVLKRSGRRARLEITDDDLAPNPPAAPLRAFPPPGLPSTSSTGSGVPPSPPPAVTYVHGSPGGRWWQSRVAPVLAAAVLVVSVGALVTVLALGGDDREAAVAANLVNARNAVEDAMAPVGRATKLESVRRAGRAARGQAARLNSPAANLRAEEDRRLADPAARLVAREREYLNALGALEGVTYAVAADRRLRTWSGMKRRLVDAHRRLLEAAVAVDALGLPEQTGAVAVTRSALETTLTRVDRQVTSAHEEIQRYQRGLARYRASKRRARDRAVPLAEYRSNVRAILAQYANERRQVDTWAASASGYDVGDMDDARAAISSFVDQRTRTIERLEVEGRRIAGGSAALLAAHRALRVPLDDSLRGLAYASEATLEFATDDSSDMTQTASWASFRRSSDAAAGNLGSVQAGWRRSVDAEVAQTRGSNIQRRPEKPSV